MKLRKQQKTLSDNEKYCQTIKIEFEKASKNVVRQIKILSDNKNWNCHLHPCIDKTLMIWFDELIVYWWYVMMKEFIWIVLILYAVTTTWYCYIGYNSFPHDELIIIGDMM